MKYCCTIFLQDYKLIRFTKIIKDFVLSYICNIYNILYYLFNQNRLSWYKTNSLNVHCILYINNNFCYLLSVDMDINGILATIANIGLTQVLIFTTLLSFVCFFIVYKWKYRKLEKLAVQLPGPPVLPIIGNAREFLGVYQG